eukprot:m.65657 g.65657  ORF g.65657 m.65657 type:complete len:187 (+) comp11749_c0_seq8:179-739(+)
MASVPALSDLAVDALVQNIDQIIGPDIHNMENVNYRYVLGYFDQLHWKSVHQLLQKMYQHRRLNVRIFRLLLHSDLEVVDLSGIAETVTNGVVGIIGSACKSIRVLNLANCNKINKGSFVKLFINLQPAWLTNVNLVNCEKLGNEGLEALANIAATSLLSLQVGDSKFHPSFSYYTYSPRFRIATE